jgi:hypothetical protein
MSKSLKSILFAIVGLMGLPILPSKARGGIRRDKRLAIMALADKHGAHSVRVFGSIARGDSGPESDVDYA